MTIIDDILEHQKNYSKRLYLVSSENSPSVTARMAFLTDILNRYYFPLPENRSWAFPGNEFIEKIHERCTTLLQEVTGARFINIKPISGVNTMTIALAALAKTGDTIASIAPENGGHPTTAALAKRLGLRVVYLPYKQDLFAVDTNSLYQFTEKERVSLIYIDQPQVLFPQQIDSIISNIPESVKTYYDGSHVMGLIFGGSVKNPLKKGADFLGGSTHKTIPGPHKGFIATNNEDWYKLINNYGKVFVSHNHGADVAALAIVLEEMKGRWNEYASQVVRNAQFLAKKLDEKGFCVIAKKFGFTNSHQIWIDTYRHMDAFEAVMALANNNIIINTIHAPSLPNGRLALRIGVQELTYCGAKEDTMENIANLFEMILFKKNYHEEKIKKQVADLKMQFFPPEDRGSIDRILNSITT